MTFFLRRWYAANRRPLLIASVMTQTLFAAHVFWEYFYEIAATRGASMLPTFPVFGDILVTDKSYRRGGAGRGKEIKVGDVVQFDSVYEPGEKVIKRVVGMPGDYVLMNTPGSRREDMVQVPQGHCWVVGDNLRDSLDSRIWGPLPMGLIRGKIIYKAFPWAERGWVKNTLEKVEEALD